MPFIRTPRRPWNESVIIGEQGNQKAQGSIFGHTHFNDFMKDLSNAIDDCTLFIYVESMTIKILTRMNIIVDDLMNLIE